MKPLRMKLIVNFYCEFLYKRVEIFVLLRHGDDLRKQKLAYKHVLILAHE